MTEEIPFIKLLFSDQFKDRLRTLAKRYRSIRTDLQPLIDDLQIGKFIGDQIPGTLFCYNYCHSFGFGREKYSDTCTTLTMLYPILLGNKVLFTN